MNNPINYSSWKIYFIHILLLLCTPIIAFECAGYMAFDTWFIFQDKSYLNYFFFIQVLWILAIILNKEFKIFSDNAAGIGKNLYHSHLTFFYYIFLMLLYIFVFKKYEYGRFFSTYVFIFIYVLTITLKIVVWQFYKYLRRKGHFTINAVIIGNQELYNKLQQYFFTNPNLGIKTIFTSHSEEIDIIKQKILDNKPKVSYLYICKDLSYKEIDSWVNFCDDNLIKLRVIVNASILSFITQPIILNYDNIPMIGLNDTPLDNVNNQIKKRLFDILFSSLILIFILSWLIPIVA
ncbi:MAG: hypothetical protein ACRC0A_06835, partial [Chitinophagaceae bacterium]